MDHLGGASGRGGLGGNSQLPELPGLWKLILSLGLGAWPRLGDLGRNVFLLTSNFLVLLETPAVKSLYKLPHQQRRY